MEQKANAGRKLSAASRRALNYTRSPEWFCRFRVSDLKGDFAYQEGIIRRDPSAVIKVGDTFYTWYTRGEGETVGFHSGDPAAKVFPWDLTEVWYATSKDGWEWHEVCVWSYKGGIAALLTTDGPEKNTIQYAPDGINFEIVAVLKGAPEALGLYRGGNPDEHPLASIRWGLCHQYRGNWQYIRRFETYLPRVV